MSLLVIQRENCVLWKWNKVWKYTNTYTKTYTNVGSCFWRYKIPQIRNNKDLPWSRSDNLLIAQPGRNWTGRITGFWGPQICTEPQNLRHCFQVAPQVNAHPPSNHGYLRHPPLTNFLPTSRHKIQWKASRVTEWDLLGHLIKLH